MTFIRNNFYSPPPPEPYQELLEDPVDKEIKNVRKLYKAETMLANIQPFLSYCEYKDIAEASVDLFPKNEKKLVRMDSKLIETKNTSPDDNWFTTLCSYVGLATNQEKAKGCIKIILAVSELSKILPNKEPIYVTNGLKSLASIYHTLPTRWSYSPVNLFKPLHVAPAIQNIFKAYNLNLDLQKELIIEVNRVHLLLLHRTMLSTENKKSF